MSATVTPQSVESLRAQRDHFIEKCAMLREKLNEAELKLSVALIGQKMDLAERVAALEKAQARTGNIVQGLPQRDELTELETKLKQLSSDYYSHSARCSC